MAPFLHSTAGVPLRAWVDRAEDGVGSGRGVTGFVGGRVDVTNTGDGGVTVCLEIVRQEGTDIESRKAISTCFVMHLFHEDHTIFIRPLTRWRLFVPGCIP
jgi:hypothetical protein